LIKLGVIAVIRTFLNYFLDREIAAEMALERERAKIRDELETLDTA
jgi:uncharacterized membrane protein